MLRDHARRGRAGIEIPPARPLSSRFLICVETPPPRGDPVISAFVKSPRRSTPKSKFQFSGCRQISNLHQLHRISDQEAMDLSGRHMHTQRKDRRGDFIPAIVAIIVAVVGTAGILLNDFGPQGNDSHGSGNARMVTAAAVARAGAIEIPSEPPTDLQPGRRNPAVLFASGSSV
jgi:hypothetical protein